MGENQVSTKRMANFELLRCIAMMMVVVLHFLGKGGVLAPLNSPSMQGFEYLAWVLESLCIVAVNVYMLISGYFLVESSFSWKKLLRLWLQVFLYSAGIGVVSYLTGYRPEGGYSIYYLARLLFPITKNHYWFMTAYFYMMLFAPFLAAGVKKLNKKQFQTLLILLLVAFSGMKSILPMNLETDRQGYDVIWYLCVFLTAAYIRLYGIPFFKNKTRSFGMYFICCGAIFAVSFALRAVYLRTGKGLDILSFCYHYNHILVLAAAVALFYGFSHMNIKEGAFSRIVCAVSPLTLGVYLLHCHTSLDMRWQEWIFALVGRPAGYGSLLLGVVVSVVLVFTAGICVDAVRRFLFYKVGRI